MFVSNPQFLGVIKSSIIKDFHNINLKIDVYKILSNDRQLIDMIKKNCDEDHSNVDTLKLVSTDVVYSKLLNYNESESFILYLRFINARNIQEDIQNKQSWIIDFKFAKDVNFFKIILDSLQVLRLYTQINSFYSNYLVLSSILRQQLGNGELKTEKVEKKVSEYITPVTPVETTPVVTPQEILSRSRTELDDIFELCLNSSIKSSLIHYTFNYFKYITNLHCKVLTNEKGQVQYTLPVLMLKNIDEQYFNSLIISNTSVASNNVIYAIKKILLNLHTNFKKYQENPLYLMMFGYLLFVYLLRYLYDSYRESYRIYFKSFIYNPDVQTQLFTKMIETGFSDFANKLYFKITDIDLSNVSDEYNLEKVTKISNDYKHLISVSQKDFADKIFVESQDNEIKQLEPKYFKISNKKFIDVTKIMSDNQKQKKISQSVLFDPDNVLDIDESAMKEYNLLDYKLQSTNGNRIITETYQHLLSYIKNPSSILLVDDKIISKEIRNLFEILVKKVLNVSRITKDNISTLSYYNILLKNIPRPECFNHTTFLHIIFQIIIPFSYDVYGNSQFEDVFL